MRFRERLGHKGPWQDDKDVQDDEDVQTAMRQRIPKNMVYGTAEIRTSIRDSRRFLVLMSNESPGLINLYRKVLLQRCTATVVTGSHQASCSATFRQAHMYPGLEPPRDWAGMLHYYPFWKRLVIIS